MAEASQRSRRALARAYRLLGDLVAGPVDAELLERARQSPLLGAALGQHPDLDGVAAEHHRAFEWSAFPQQGVFLDSGGWADGSSSRALRAEYRQVGFQPRDEVPVDHLANILGALAAALEAPERAEELQLALLDGHLLCWLPALVESVSRLELGVPMAIVSQLEDLVLYHRDVLGLDAKDPTPFLLPSSPLLLEDPKTSLADIADFLVSSARSGLFLSREDISRAARQVGCFCGFGERRTMLLNALRTAVQHDRLPQLTESLAALHRDWETALLGRLEIGLPEGLVSPWVEHSRATRAMLQILAAAGAVLPGAPAGPAGAAEGLAP